MLRSLNLFFAIECFATPVIPFPTITCFLIVLHGCFSEEPVSTSVSVKFLYYVRVSRVLLRYCVWLHVMNYVGYGCPSRSGPLTTGL